VGSVKEVGCHGFSEKSNMLQRRIIPMSKIVLSPSSFVEENIINLFSSLEAKSCQNWEK